jgi:hypothetical protein
MCSGGLTALPAASAKGGVATTDIPARTARLVMAFIVIVSYAASA